MAVSKLWSVTHSLKKVIDYVSNPEKTEHEYFVDGINCNPLTARDQFVTVKEQFAKTGGIQAYHGYLSFEETNITPEFAQKVGMEFANRVWGKRFQIVVSTHLNTGHLHCHFVINSVSFADGKKLQNEEKAWFKFRHVADEVCKEFGLSYNPTPNRSKQSSYYYNVEKENKPTRYSILRTAIDEAISRSMSLSEFAYYLKQMGYEYQLSENRKYWTVVPKGYNKPIRLKNLGEDYTTEMIIKRLKENCRKGILRPFQKSAVIFLPYDEWAKKNKIQNAEGLHSIYLYYCYRLGAFSRKKQNTAQLYYLLKDDLIKIDEITQQTRLLGKYCINTDGQLLLFKSKHEEEIKVLTSERDILRSRLRRKIPAEEFERVKKQISEKSEHIKILRKEVKLCDGILRRSNVIKDNIDQITKDEEKQKTKGDFEL